MRRSRRLFMVQAGAVTLGVMAAASRVSLADDRKTVVVSCNAKDTDQEPAVDFTITFDVQKKAWTQKEPNDGKAVFKTKSGKYGIQVSKTSLLRTNDNYVVADMEPFNPGTCNVGDSDTDANAFETGRHFSWKVKSIS
jgi:hypothetical protein